MAGRTTRLSRDQAAAPAEGAGEARNAPPAAVQPNCLAGSACSDSCLCQGPGYTCDAGICKVGCSRQVESFAAAAEPGWLQEAHPLGLPAHLRALTPQEIPTLLPAALLFDEQRLRQQLCLQDGHQHVRRGHVQGEYSCALCRAVQGSSRGQSAVDEDHLPWASRTCNRRRPPACTDAHACSMQGAAETPLPACCGCRAAHLQPWRQLQRLLLHAGHLHVRFGDLQGADVARVRHGSWCCACSCP